MKEGLTVLILNPPLQYGSMLGTLPKRIHFKRRPSPNLDFIQYFTTSRRDLVSEIGLLKQSLSPTGTLWITWPKTSSGVKTDLSASVMKEICGKVGLIDVKTCSIDDTWSAIKFMYAPDGRE